MDLKLVWIATQRHPIGRPDSGFTGATPFPANGDGWITKRTPPRARFFCPGIESTPLPPGNSDPGGDESIGGCPETSRKMAPPFPTAFGETTPGSRSLANSFDLSLQFRQIHSSLKLEIFFSGKNRPPYFPSSYFLSFAYFFFFSFYSFLFIYFFFKYAITSIHPALKENFYYRWDKFFRSERVRREMLSKMESITERNSTNVVHLRTRPTTFPFLRDRFSRRLLCLHHSSPPPPHQRRIFHPSSPRGHDPLLIRGAQSSEALSNYIYSLLGRKLPAPRGGKN